MDAALRRLIDSIYVTRGGVRFTHDSISSFVAAVGADADEHVIKRFLRTALGCEEDFCETSVRGKKDRSCSPQQVRFLSVDECTKVVKDCMEVERRRTVGGNDQHYFNLAWAGCGGADNQSGVIDVRNLTKQLQQFGVVTEIEGVLPPSPRGRPQSPGEAEDGGPLHTIGFSDMVALVSVNHRVLHLAATTSSVKALHQSAVLNGPDVSIDEQHVLKRQAVALFRFKLRLRSVIARRRQRKREEAARLLQHTQSMRHLSHARLKPMMSTNRRKASFVSNLSPTGPLPAGGAPSSGSLPLLSNQAPSLSARISPHRGPRSDAADSSPIMKTTSVEPQAEPSLLHVSSLPWHRNHPFKSTKLAADWIARPAPGLPPISDCSVSASRHSVNASERRVVGVPPTATLKSLRQRLEGLLEEQLHQVAHTSASPARPPISIMSSGMNKEHSDVIVFHDCAGEAADVDCETKKRSRKILCVDVACQASDVDIAAALGLKARKTRAPKHSRRLPPIRR